MQQPTAEAKSYYVRRESVDGRVGYVGSIRSRAQAHREAEAWRSCGQTAVVLPNTPQVRAQVRAWQKAVKERRAAR
jgi:hypothetical protein